MAAIKKSVAKKPLATKQSGGSSKTVKKNVSEPRFKNPVKATKDSTQYYEDKYSHFREAEQNLKNVDPKNAAKAKALWNQAADDRNRQKRKGVPGFDSNGNPMQYKKGGVAKKKMGGVTKKKC